ncbi:MAG: signal peptide peptidase SppA [Polyangiaceae bacterium]
MIQGSPKRRLGRALAAITGVVAATGPLTAHAQRPPWTPAESIASPGRTVASADDATAIAVNPALLPFVPDTELRWNWTWASDDALTPARGHAFSLATPLWFLGTGLRLDALDPSKALGYPYSTPYYWLRWGLGASLGETLSVGATFGWSFARERVLDNIVTMTAGLAYRPSRYLSLGLVARDFNQPSTGPVERTYDAAVALRPIEGNRRLEFDLTGTWYERSQMAVPGITVGVDVPYVGRARGDVRVFDLGSDPKIAVTAGLDVNIDRAEISGGVVAGDAYGPSPGFYAGAALHPFRSPGVPLPARVAKIRLTETPGPRGHTRLLRRLWRIANDPEIDGVAFVLRAEPASSFAHAEELGDAIRLLRLKGKKSFCHLEDAGGRSLYVCAQTDHISMNPAGGLRFAGLASRYFYLGGLLEKAGVKADFVRIGAHKTAAEQFTLKTSTQVAHDDHQETIDQIERVFLNDVGGGRKIPVGELKKCLNRGPFIAREAKAQGLVDTLAYEDEIVRVAEEVFGRAVRLADDGGTTRAPTYWSDAPKIALVYLAGDMVDGESQTVPFVDIKLAGSATIARALRRAREDRSVKAVVFRMETGGGSSLAADVLLREAQLTAKVKPFIVSMGGAAASGGYYASMAGAPVFASRTTITGSIGIFYGKADVQGLMKLLGANVETIRTSPRADAESFYRPFTDDERTELGVKVKQFYDTFIGRVAEGRKMKPEDVDAIARGKVWTGEQALPLHLIDKLGGLREAIAEAKRLSGAPDETMILELPEEDDTLLGALLKMVGITSASAGLLGPGIPPLFLDVARSLAPFMIYGDRTPLALSEMTEEVSFGGLLTAKAQSPDEDEKQPPPRARAIPDP